MDVLRFVNSSAIREHLDKIGYCFEQNEIAWLIWQCSSASFREKKDAWNQLMTEYADTELHKHCNLDGCSLFEAIRKYVELKERIYQKFLKNEAKGIYSYEYYCPGDSRFCEEFECHYSSFEKCWNRIEEDMQFGMSRIIVRKDYVDCEEARLEIEYRQEPDGSWEVYDVYSYGLAEEEFDYNLVFEQMYFEFPVPFVKGDIVHIPQEGMPWYEEEKSAFVYETVSYESYNDYFRQHADSSDMQVGGYFVDRDGSVYGEGTGNYMDLEYYNKPLEGTMRTIKAISSFEEGEIDLCLLLCAYRKFLIREAEQENTSVLYTDTALVKAGILPETAFDKKNPEEK